MNTDFPFTLPRGFVDAAGNLRRNGRMRLATARDEIESMNDPRVLANEAYLPVLLLSRVIVQLGDLSPVPPQIVESLFASDLAYLEDLYERLNAPDHVVLGAVCPHCSTRFQIQVAPLESV
jgi:hypothetical protein